MKNVLMNNKGLTMIEILVSGILLAVMAVASYSALIYILSISSLSRDELEANTEIGGWAEQAKSLGTTWYDLSSHAWRDLNAGNSILPTNYLAQWPLNLAVDRRKILNLKAEYRVIDNASFDSNPAYDFRKIDLRVTWDERR